MKRLSLPSCYFHVLAHFLLMKSSLCLMSAHADSLNFAKISLPPHLIPPPFFWKMYPSHEYFNITFLFELFFFFLCITFITEGESKGQRDSIKLIFIILPILLGKSQTNKKKTKKSDFTNVLFKTRSNI